MFEIADSVGMLLLNHEQMSQLGIIHDQSCIVRRFVVFDVLALRSDDYIETCDCQPKEALVQNFTCRSSSTSCALRPRNIQ